MEVKLDTNVPGYGGEIIRHLDAMIGQRFLENPHSYVHDRLLYAMSREERQWVGKSLRTLQLVHPETQFLLVSVNQLRIHERLAVREEQMGRNGGGTSFIVPRSGNTLVQETKNHIRQIKDVYATTYQHFMEAPQHALPEFPPVTKLIPETDIQVPQFYRALRQRIGFLKASELETALHRFHSVVISHGRECLPETMQLREHLHKLVSIASAGQDGRLTSYGDTVFELQQSLGESVQSQKHIEHQFRQEQASRGAQSRFGWTPGGHHFL